MNKIIFHIDVNNAFLSWTAIDLLKSGSKLDLRDISAVIGGDRNTRRGIVLAKSVIAKEKGIITGESLYNAFLKDKNLQVYPPNFELYSKMSNDLFALIYNYSPDIEVFSIDECFLDYTNVQKLYGDPLLFAKRLSEEIHLKLGFTVNIGIGNNKLCAKMASDFSKPNKIHTLFPDEIESKLWPLPINNLLWIGKKSTIILKELGINTIGDLASADPLFLSRYFKNQTLKMIESAKGNDASMVVSDKWIPKGISNSTTFPHDLENSDEILLILESLCENVAISLRKEKKYACVIGITIKDQYFKSYSHQRRLVNATNMTKEIFKIAKELFIEAWNKEPIRLVGVRLDNLVDNVCHQISLFESFDERLKDNKLDTIVDDLKMRYGSDKVSIASTLKSGIKKKKTK